MTVLWIWMVILIFAFVFSICTAVDNKNEAFTQESIASNFRSAYIKEAKANAEMAASLLEQQYNYEGRLTELQKKFLAANFAKGELEQETNDRDKIIKKLKSKVRSLQRNYKALKDSI
jgi:hypothetical protein